MVRSLHAVVYIALISAHVVTGSDVPSEVAATGGDVKELTFLGVKVDEINERGEASLTHKGVKYAVLSDDGKPLFVNLKAFEMLYEDPRITPPIVPGAEVDDYNRAFIMDKEGDKWFVAMDKTHGIPFFVHADTNPGPSKGSQWEDPRGPQPKPGDAGGEGQVQAPPAAATKKEEGKGNGGGVLGWIKSLLGGGKVKAPSESKKTPPSSATSSSLPTITTVSGDEWYVYKDGEKSYYVHTRTHHTQWEDPRLPGKTEEEEAMAAENKASTAEEADEYEL